MIEVPLIMRRGTTMQRTPRAVRLLRQVRLALAKLRAGLDDVATMCSQHAGCLTLGVMSLARARRVLLEDD